MKKSSAQRVLVVDDDAGCRQLYTIIITECFPTITVDHAPNGEDAVDLFTEYHYGAVVMDVHMPNHNGAATAKSIGQHCAREDWEPPLIVLLAHYVPPTWLEGTTGAMTRLLPKPVKSEDLITALRFKLASK